MRHFILIGVLIAALPTSGCTDLLTPGPDCAKEEGDVGLSTFASMIVAPRGELEVATFQSDCNGQCPLTKHRWVVAPSGAASGTLTITYGAHCGPSSNGQYSNDTIGQCTVGFNGAAMLTDASLAESHSADCIALWAEVNPDDPGQVAPCGAGSRLNFRPYVIFQNHGNVPVTVSGPGPAHNPIATCSYVDTP